MRKLIILLFFIFLKQVYSFSQDSILILHPIIGEIIDNIEKRKYLLFTEIEDTAYSYAYIKYSDNKYYLNVTKTGTNAQYVKQLDSSEIHQYYINITKLNEYFSSFPNKDSIEVSEIEKKIREMDNINKEIKVIDKSLMDQINEQIIINDRIKYDAETIKLSEKGFKNFSKFYYPGAKN
jgi:hypothetical protein